jgi:hypothetical protein
MSGRRTERHEGDGGIGRGSRLRPCSPLLRRASRGGVGSLALPAHTRIARERAPGAFHGT